MRTDDRHKYILNIAQPEGFVSISKAAVHLNVSIETVRRDINQLSADGQLKKTRGGATPVKQPFRKDADYVRRLQLNQQEKFAIGAEAATLIRSGSIVALDCGVSIQTMAKCISGVENVTFVTNSIRVAGILLDKIDSGEISGRAILIGGEMDNENRFAKGAEAINSLKQYHFDLAFVSCTAASTSGVSSYSLDESNFSAQMIANSARSVLVAESVKLGKNSVKLFAELNEFERIITDDRNPIPTDIEAVLRNIKTKLIIVNCT